MMVLRGEWVWSYFAMKYGWRIGEVKKKIEIINWDSLNFSLQFPKPRPNEV